MPYEEMSGMQHHLELSGRERLVVSGVEEAGGVVVSGVDAGPGTRQGGLLRRLFG